MDIREWQKLTETERRELVLAEPCTEKICLAGAGERCKTVIGVRTIAFHSSRVTAARSGEVPAKT